MHLGLMVLALLCIVVGVGFWREDQFVDHNRHLAWSAVFICAAIGFMYLEYRL